ncbi:MAG: ATP-dependent DNA helicase [Betaproteobacteria bacterium]|nr:ATP-dependent DNA helicase [Betaproteobacteria bacterium]
MTQVASTDLHEVFGPGGRLAEQMTGYRVRPQQLEMAEHVAQAIRGNGTAILEAGTGTGKTVAYLVPALLCGGKVIISTGTKTLQDQLYHRDLPLVRSALNVPVTTALLKGRANYVCHYYLQRNLLEGRLGSRLEVSQLQAIARFARTTGSGDKSELPEVPEGAAVWGLATSTRENCLGQACKHHDQCFVMSARKEALAADVVVVNHHLFFADVVLRDEGMTELLPACNTVILDEAHQLPQTATLFFGETTSTAQLTDLARDARNEALAEARDAIDLPPLAATLDKAARDLRLAVGEGTARLAERTLRAKAAFHPALEAVERALLALHEGLARQAARAEGLERCAERAAGLLAQVSRWRDPDEADSEHEVVRWAEAFGSSLQLHATPLSIAAIFRRQIAGRPRAWILTSATLTVGGDFSHYAAEMGLEHAATGSWDSPFDYERNALLYIPRRMPDPGSLDHTEAVVEAALPVIHANPGGTFLLFTTLRAMRHAHEALRQKLNRDTPLLLQGESSRTELLDRFRRLGKAVLVASASFWEGVDVRGDALSLVVIDKLPFAPPDDPVIQARLEKMERSGRNPFMEYQVPQAALSLKQGAGRLIRDESDRGVLMICDNRLITRPYGRRILPGLPPMRQTRELDEVIGFFNASEKPVEHVERKADVSKEIGVQLPQMSGRRAPP